MKPHHRSVDGGKGIRRGGRFPDLSLGRSTFKLVEVEYAAVSRKAPVGIITRMPSQSKNELTGSGIESRRDLYRFLQTQMRSAYDSLAERKRLDYESRYLKSMIIEVDAYKTRISREDTDKVLRDLFATGKKDNQVEVIKKTEEGFFELVLRKGREAVASLFVDTVGDERFWLIHSLSKSEALDSWLRATVQQNSNIDHLWLWPGFLEKLQGRGDPRGFGLSYDFSNFQRQNTETASHLKMRLWGGQESTELYTALKENPLFADKVVLASIRSKYISDETDPSKFVLEDVKFTGKFVAHGSDFAGHLGILQHVRNDYQSTIRGIEDKYSISWVEREQGRVHIEGHAIHFIPHRNLDVNIFTESVFDGSAPFRLMGYDSSIGQSNHSFIMAVDQHTGGKLSFEIWPDQISLYLPDGSCGNTVARFFTNLQHFFSAQFTVESDNGDSIF